MRPKRAILPAAISALFSALPIFAYARGSMGPGGGDLVGMFKAAATSIGSSAVTFAIEIIAYVLNFLGGLAFSLGETFVELMLKINYSVLDSSNTIVYVGWNITRDVANLGFVLLIILIALATIIRYPSDYQTQKLLPRLIAAALLVNFSLAIVTPLIDFADTLTQSFETRITGTETSIGGLSVPASSGHNFASRMAKAFGPQRLILHPQGTAGKSAEENSQMYSFGGGILASIGGIFFSLILTWLAAFIMFALAFMLFLRYVHLTFLLAVAPAIWLFWVFPGLEKHWSNWWADFMKWVFFAPSSMFFIYLTVMTADTMAQLPFEQTAGSGFFDGALTQTLSQGTQMFVMGALLVASLIVAQKMGITGAQGALNIAKAAKTQGLKLAGQRAQALKRSAAGKAKTALEGGFEEKGLMKYPKKWMNVAGKGTSYVLGGAKTVDEALKVKDTDKGLKRFGKRALSGVLGVTGGRAVLKAAGGAQKTIATAAGRDVKVDSIPGSMFKAMKGQFFREMGFEEEKPEKTTDDYVKTLSERMKRYKAMKDSGAIKDGDDLDKQWNKEIARDKAAVRGSLERPATVEGWDNRKKRLQEIENKMILNPEISMAANNLFKEEMQECDNEAARIRDIDQRTTEPTREMDAKVNDLRDRRARALVEGDPTVKVTEKDEEGHEREVDKKLTELLDKQIAAAEEIRNAMRDLDGRIWRKQKPWEDPKIMGDLSGLHKTAAKLNTGFAELNKNIAKANEAKNLSGERAIPTVPQFVEDTIKTVEKRIEDERLAAEKGMATPSTPGNASSV